MGRYFNDDMTEDQNDDYHKLPKSYRNKKSLELSNELANKETKELNKVRRKIRR